MADRMTITIYGDRTEHSIEFPARWMVCPTCSGEGKSSAYLGAFTAEEWNDQGKEFREDYLAGRYDRPCERCSGRSTIQVVDTRRLTRWQRRLHAEYLRQRRDLREIDAISEMERRMGA